MPASRDVVYVVDDDESVCHSVERLLRSRGFSVRAFTSAESFLRSWGTADCECVVVDVQMPGTRGLELQQCLAQADETLPIIFISGHVDAGAIVQAMKSGAVDFLPKPFHDWQLVDAVRLSLRKCHEARARRAERVDARARLEALTPRERQVMSLVISGRLNKQIALELGITEQTVKVHRGRVMKKMRVTSIAELVFAASKAAGSPLEGTSRTRT